MPFIIYRGTILRNPRVKPTIEPDYQSVSIQGLNPGIGVFQSQLKNGRDIKPYIQINLEIELAELNGRHESYYLFMKLLRKSSSPSHSWPKLTYRVLTCR